MEKNCGKRVIQRFESGIACSELAKELGVTRQYIYLLRRQGYDETEIRARCSYKSLYEICKEQGVNYRTVYSRVKRGWSVDDAITKPVERERKQKIKSL